MKIFPTHYVNRFIRGSPPAKVRQHAARYDIRLIRSTDPLPYGGQFYPCWLPSGNARSHCFMALIYSPDIGWADLEKALDDCAAYFGLKPATPQKETANVEENLPLMLDIYGMLKRLEGENGQD